MSKSRSSKTFLFLIIFAAFSGGLLLSWTLTEPAPEPISAHVPPPSPREQVTSVIVEKAGLSDPALEVIAELRVQLNTLSLRLAELSHQQEGLSIILAESLADIETDDSLAQYEQHQTTFPLSIEGEEDRKNLSNSIEERIDSGKPDDAWSRFAQSEFERELDEHKVESLDVRQIQCIEDLCRIEIVILDPMQAFHDSNILMPQIFPWEAETLTVVGENDPSRVTVYAAREGYSLLEPGKFGSNI